MKLQRLSLYALVTIAAITGTQVAAQAQPQFKTPTHPILSEITGTSQRLTNQPESMTFSQFKTPTHPTLAEIGSSSNRSIPAMQPQAGVSTGQMFFSRVPRLVRVEASQKGAYEASTYEFTVSVPSDAGAPLQAVRIVQDQNFDTVKFNISQSKAFMGERYAAGPELPLASVGGAQPAPGEATIVFNQPVQPGSTVTIALDVKANPPSGGVYEFGVTAFPAGEKGMGQFLGYGRINLYSGGH